MSQSTEVLQAMQQLVKVPEVARTMQEMSKEMMKAGIMEEMMEDTFEGLEDQDELEEAAQEEVDKVRHCTLSWGFMIGCGVQCIRGLQVC